MTLKRLYYDFTMHGGSVGFHDLGQGSSYEHQLLWHPIAIYVFRPFLTHTDINLGTALQPGLLISHNSLTFLSANQLATVSEPDQESLYTSHWGVTFLTDAETGGYVEFIFDSNRRQ
jgi:hypothetical protein